MRHSRIANGVDLQNEDVFDSPDDTPPLNPPSAYTLILVCAAYYGAARFGFGLTIGPHPVSIFWPPNAILLAALLLTPSRSWPLVLLAALPAHLAVEMIGTNIPARMVLCWFVSNCSEALIGAGAVRWLIGGPLRFDRINHVVVFVIFGAFLAAFGSSFLDAGFVMLNRWGNNTYWDLWRVRFFSNSLANLTLVPAIVAWRTQSAGALRAAFTRRWVEASLLVLTLFAVCVISFGGFLPHLDEMPAFLYAPLPIIVWAAVRFGPGSVGASLLCVGFFAIWGVLHGQGPFTIGSPEQNALSVQLFLIMVSMPLMTLAAVIEERRRAEQQLLGAQRIAALATAAGRVSIWVMNLETGEIQGDGVLPRLLGWAPGERHNYNLWLDAIHPSDRDRVLANETLAFATAAKGGITEKAIPEIEYRILHRDGSTRWLLTRGTVLHRADGRPYQVVRTGIDITDQKRAESSLRESEERMAFAAIAANLGFWTWDLRSGRMWASDHCREICGFTDATLTRQACFEAILPADRSRIFEIFEQAITARAPYDAEFRLTHTDRSVHWVRVRGRTSYDTTGKCVRMSGVVLDITSRKQAEQEAEEQRRELAHLGRVSMLGEFSGALAHELTQPLTAILSNAQAAERMLVRDPLDTVELREILHDIIHDDKRATDVIRQLRRMLAKDDAHFECINLTDLVRDTLAIAHADLAVRGVSLDLHIVPNLKPVLGARVQLQQVILNLILNACDAMSDNPAGARGLSIAAAPDADNTIRLSVRDCGSGISPEALARIFEPFFTTKATGLGLGLAICRSIVTLHGGRLYPINNTDRGATFYLVLPARDPVPTNGQQTSRNIDAMPAAGFAARP